MSEVTLRHEIETDEDTFWKLVFDETFNKRMYERELKFPGWKLLDMKEDDAKIVRRIQVDPPVKDIPAAVKKVIGDKLGYVEDGSFDKQTKRYAIKITPSAMAEKSKITGELWTEKNGDKKIWRVCRMTVEVKVFMVGGLVEDRIIQDLRSAYDAGAAFTNKYVKEQGL
jgi:hypothetical protein